MVTPQFDALLQHPALWRGRSAAPAAGLSSGFAALDAVLPGGGWPRQGLIEILTGHGHGELTLCTPLLRQLSGAVAARWCAFVAPPFEPFAPAWQSHGVQLDRLLVVRATGDAAAGWALEQALLSGACALGFAWLDRMGMTSLRRLALAAERGAALGVLIRPQHVAAQHSAAVLRLLLTRTATRLRVQLLKGRGLSPCTVELPWP